LPEEAGGAGRRLAEDLDVAIGGDARGCKFGTGTAEKGNGRRLHGCGEMHGAGVVSENTAAGGERGGKIA
tara:strand:+ start:400 stop:609 length:210 start_codon:yes stop_codon:yes gene_type:complete